MEDFQYGIPQGLGFIIIFPNHVTVVFGFCTFQVAFEVVHCDLIPSVIYSRVASPFLVCIYVSLLPKSLGL